MQRPALFFFLNTALFSLLPGCTTAPIQSDPSDSDIGDSDGDRIPGAQAFSQPELITYRIEMDPEDREELEEAGNEEIYLPASLEVEGGDITKRYLEVGFRHKGAWSLHHCYEEGYRSYEEDCAKISYKIKFSAYDKDARFFGLKRINLHAMSGDDTKLRERLAYDMFNEMGVIAPRTAYARLYINDEPMGLFVQVEQIDGRFTAHHFPHDGDGNLYKEVWPKAGFGDSHFLAHLKTNENPEDNPDVSDIQAFAAAIEASDETDFVAMLEDWVDRENLLRYIAVDRASKNWDGIMTFYSPSSPHNFYWYHEALEGGRFHLIPWDMDNTFWEFDPVVYPEQWVTSEPVPNWNVKPASCDPIPLWEPEDDVEATPPGCDKMINLLARTSWDAFVDAGESLLAGPLRMEVMEAKVDAWMTEIDAAVAEDPYLDYDNWAMEAGELKWILKRAIRDFEDHLEEGYSVQEPEVEISEPEDEVLNATMPESGLLVDIVNNYEFEGGAAGSVPEGVTRASDDGTETAVRWNTDAPISGEADLRIDFEAARSPGAWDEWIDVRVAADENDPIDLTDYSEISLTMKSDRSRTVRIKVDSPVYNQTFGGVWPSFMVEFSVTTEPKIFKLKRDRLRYPEWAKDAWADGDGWTGDDDEALALVLAKFSGLIVSPILGTDSDGELLEDPENGFVQVDNIYFR